MRRLASLMLAISLCAGCATATPKTAQEQHPRYRTESTRLTTAVALMNKGDNAGAVKILESITTSNPVPGVTDEALFRLVLLSLKPTTERPASHLAHQLLRRLKREYPSSPWTAQVQPLIGLIGAAEELRRQNRNYKATNQSLNNELRELNQNIESLKHLDLELEKTTR